MDEASTSASVGQADTGKQSHEATQEGTTQVSIQEFFIKKAKDTITSERVVEPCGSKDTEWAMTVQDQIMKAETLWTLKTASENLSFRVSDGVPELFQKMFPDSTIAKHMRVERVKSQLPALLECFKKLPDTDKKINSNERYKKIMVILTAPEMIVQLCFLKSIKPVFDRFLQMFQTEGPLIHVLHQAMLDLLKQVMSRFLRQSVVKGRSVNELLKVDSKNIDFQLKNDELDVGNEIKKAVNDFKQSGKQRQCFLGIRSFFTAVVAYMQKSLELRNPLVEAMSCLQPEQRTKDSSLQKIRLVGSQLPCVKPEEVILLTDEWRMYAETDIPEEWIQQEVVRL